MGVVGRRGSNHLAVRQHFKVGLYGGTLHLMLHQHVALVVDQCVLHLELDLHDPGSVNECVGEFASFRVSRFRVVNGLVLGTLEL